MICPGCGGTGEDPQYAGQPCAYDCTLEGVS